MAIVQISKIQQRSGNLVDLPQLDEAQFGFAADAKRLFIGKTTGDIENIEVLTSYSDISFSQINGSDGGNFNISNAQNGQILTYVSSTDTWENYTGNSSQLNGSKLQLGNVANIKIEGGAIGYVLETDGLGNLSWTPKGTLYTPIEALSNATPIIMTVANTTPYTNGTAITISGADGANANSIVNGQTFYITLAVDYATSGNVELYTDSGRTIGANGTDLGASTPNVGIATSVIGSGGAGAANAGGANTQVQFNNTNLLDGDPGFTYNYITGLVSVTGNITTGNLNSAGTLTASRLISNVSTGSGLAPLTVTSTIRVANLNVSYSNVSDFEVVTSQTTGTFYPVFVSSSSTGNYALGSNANISFNAATGNLNTVLLNVTSNANVGNLGTAGLIVATGNITGGNLTTAGRVSVTGNANVGNLGTAGLIVATGNITGGNIATGGVVAATGNVSGGNLTTAGRLSVTGNANVGNIGAAAGVFTTVTGSLVTAAQPNVTSLGSLTGLTMAANADITLSGAGSNVQGANIVSASFLAGTLTTAAQPNITSVGTLTSLTVSGSVTGGNLITTGNANIGTLRVTGTSNLGPISNVTITGGNANQILKTNGSGSLSWTDPTGGYYLHTQSVASNTWTIVHNLNNQYLSVDPIDSTGNSYIGRYDYPTVNYTNANAVTLTFTSAVTGYCAIVGGGFTYANGNGTATPAGLNTYVQFNDAGTLGGQPTLTFNKTSGTLSATLLAGTLTTAAQSNITSVGTLTSLGVSGNITAANITANTGIFAGNGSGLTALNASNISSGTLAQARLANASVTLGSTSLTLGSTVTSVTGLTSVTSTTFVGALTGAATSATTAGTVTTAAQPNITSVGTLTGLTIAANGDITMSGTGSNINGVALVSATLFAGSGANLTNLNGSNISSGTIAAARIATLNQNTTGYAATVSSAAQPNITSVGTLTGLTLANASVISMGSNANVGTFTGNFTLSAGSRLTATYADLAEYYEADQNYEPGTVLEFGGEKEVTLATDETRRVAGVVSTNPAYAMNAECPGHAVAIALQGRVPVKVRGTIRKGDMLVSGGNGYARPTHDPKMGTVIGKALENFEGTNGIIEIAVGRL